MASDSCKYPNSFVKNATKFLPGVDSRGDGGYFIGAPSGHVSGNRYQWRFLPESNDQLPPLPQAILDTINGISPNGEKPRFNTADALNGAPEGQRKDTIFKLACKFRRSDLPYDIAEELILRAWSKCDQGGHPFSEKEALRELRDAYQRYSPVEIK